jgi:hypothetical protein
VEHPSSTRQGDYFVITADQINSRQSADAVAEAIAACMTIAGAALYRAPERTVGDEFQIVLTDAKSVLDVILDLNRRRQWSVGCGIGSAHEPIPESIREASGAAFIAARDAVTRAKKRSSRFSLVSPSSEVSATNVEALIELLLMVRDRRSPEGWEVYDLLATGLTQAEAALALGISPQAASRRAQSANLKVERAARLAVIEALATLARPA